jgi:hypothetical protein
MTEEKEEELTNEQIGKLATLARNAGMSPNEYSTELLLSVASLGATRIGKDKHRVLWNLGKTNVIDKVVAVAVFILPLDREKEVIELEELWGEIPTPPIDEHH